MEFVKLQMFVPSAPIFSSTVSYNAIKDLKPIEINNDLTLRKSAENTQLLESYFAKKIPLIPVRRVSNFSTRSDFPSRVLLEMTSRCNLVCTMCPSRKLTRDKMDISPELFKKCVDELDDKGLDGIWIYNIGESILHPDFEILLHYTATKKNLGPVWLSSNGQDLNKTFRTQIIDSKIQFMNLSVNATTKTTHSKVSPGASWENIQENFKSFLKEKKNTGNRFPISRVQIIDQECATHEVDAFLSEYLELADLLSVNTLEGFSQNVETNNEYSRARQRGEKRCRRVSRQDLFIFSNGETTFCDTDFNGVFSLGNVQHDTIAKIWNSQTRNNILKMNQEGRLGEIDLCSDCLDFDL